MSNVEGIGIPQEVRSGLVGQWEDHVAERAEHWTQLVEQIVQLEELIADLREDREAQSAITVRKLSAMLKDRRLRLKAIDVGA